jgi:UDP-N-acetylmuramate--alanine ligase
MLSHILKSSDVDCTAFFGGISKNYNTNFLLSETSKYMIVEADEYDKSFLTLSPDIAVITSLDADHLDVYKSHEEFINAFQEFIFQVKENGCLIIEESIVNYFKKPKNVRLLTYSSSSTSDYYISEISQKDNSLHFTYHTKDTSDNSRDIVLPMLGKHNLSNALAAISVSDLLNINHNSISSSFSNFEGINRRFDIHMSNKKIVYIDDYAHHPEEIKSTISGIIDSFPQRKLTVIFQPHLFSRTRDFAKDFAQSLSQADELILLDIYPAREEPIAGVDSKMLLDLCTNNSKIVFKNNELLSYLKDNKNDVVVTLGAGNISDLVKPIISVLSR